MPFVYIVGERGAPVETWGREANLFHNPKAKHPIPVDLFDTVTNSQVVNGQYIDRFKDDFKPIMSMSNLINGPGHRRSAEAIADRLFASLEQIYPSKSALNVEQHRPAECRAVGPQRIYGHDLSTAVRSASQRKRGAHLSVMRRDQYHWKLMQPEGQLIDWPLLFTWVAQSRFGKAFGPWEIPILNADADFIRWLGAEIVAAAAESAHAAERPAMARPNQNPILLMAFFSTESG